LHHTPVAACVLIQSLAAHNMFCSHCMQPDGGFPLHPLLRACGHLQKRYHGDLPCNEQQQLLCSVHCTVSQLIKSQVARIPALSFTGKGWRTLAKFLEYHLPLFIDVHDPLPLLPSPVQSQLPHSFCCGLRNTLHFFQCVPCMQNCMCCVVCAWAFGGWCYSQQYATACFPQ